MVKKVFTFIIAAIGVVSGIMTIISFVWMVADIKIEKINIVLDFNFLFGKLGIWIFGLAMAVSISSITYLIIQRRWEREKKELC